MEPDISVICDNGKLDDRGCNGAPDWVIEIVSQSSQRMDYLTKLFKYRTAGVREYWIVNPMKRTVLVYLFGENEDSTQYLFEDEIPGGNLSGFYNENFRICVNSIRNKHFFRKHGANAYYGQQ